MRITISIISIILLLTVLTACGRKQEQKPVQPVPKDTVAVAKPAIQPKQPVKQQPKQPTRQVAKQQPPARKGTIKEEDLPRYIQPLQPKIQRIFKQRCQVVPMQGSMKITVVFASSGDVKSVAIEPDEKSSFTDSFVKEVKEIVESWHLDVEHEMKYSFRMSFYQ